MIIFIFKHATIRKHGIFFHIINVIKRICLIILLNPNIALINQKKSLSLISRKENNLPFWHFAKLNLNSYFIKIFNWQIFKSRMFSNVTIMLFVNHDILVVLFLHSALIITQKGFNLKESPYIFLKFVLFTTCPSPYKYTYLNSYSLDAIH